jgi:hypothetical protein
MSFEDFPDNRGPGRPPKYPFRTLAVGEAAFIAGTTTKNVHRHAYLFKPRRFKVRKVVKNGAAGVRVMRVQ